ncbi:MAG: hypothetical protein TREMPRED_005867, partial [Tremellales sp. Tagirdzhanova-0007]
ETFAYAYDEEAESEHIDAFEVTLLAGTMSGPSVSGMTTLKRFASPRIVALVSLTFIIVSFSLVVLLPLDFASNIIVPYWNKASDLWTGEHVVMTGREAARGALADVGMKESFRTNLRKDAGYLVSWGGSAGWTNVLFTQLKHIHLAKMSHRIPIILPTIPHVQHLALPAGQSAQPMLMSDIFDFPRFSQSIGIPLLEMEDLKGPSIARGPLEVEREDPRGTITEFPWETLGCWSLMQTSQNNTEAPWFFEGGRMKLDFTPMPSSVLMPEYPAPYGLAALTNLGRLLEYHPQDSIAKFGMPQVNETEVEQQRMWHPGWNLPPVDPENDIACIDAYLYYTLPTDGYEGQQWLDREDDDANTWMRIGTHLHWRQDVQDLADQYIRNAFGLNHGERIPPYISVHVRRTDLMWGCKNDAGEIDLDCLSPALYGARAREVKELLLGAGVDIGEHIVVTTDETDPVYRAALLAEGMTLIDHGICETADIYGPWWPTILDAVFLAGAAGFVGTEGSTMSEIAIRRVEDWNGGVTAQVHQWDRLRS